MFPKKYGKNIQLLKSLKQPVDSRILFSVILFLVCMILDFGATEYFSGGDFTAEGNTLNALWWEIWGPLRHIDIPIWIGYVLFITLFFMNWKITASHLTIPLWWLNAIALSHFFGFLTWLPQNPLGFLYEFFGYRVDMTFVFSSIGVILGFLLAQIQIRYTTHRSKQDHSF